MDDSLTFLRKLNHRALATAILVQPLLIFVYLFHVHVSVRIAVQFYGQCRPM